MSCTATADSWLVTTDNQSGSVQVLATPAYNPTTFTTLNKASPIFSNNNSITGGTYWASGENEFSASGTGNQWLQIEYPSAVKMTSYRINPSNQYSGGQGAPLQWTISASKNKTFISGWSVGMTSLLSAQLDHEANLRATPQSSLAPRIFHWIRRLYTALGYTLDAQLSMDNTMVFIDNIAGQPTIAHRGSVTAKDWLVDDVLIAAGANRETERLRQARQITAAAEMKYKQKSNAVGHSLGGRLVERSGSGGEIVTFNKASGLGDIRSRLPNGTRQTDVQTKLDAVSALSSLGRRTSGVRGGDRGGGRGRGGGHPMRIPVELSSVFFVSFYTLVTLARH
ncbi:hypothetical protein T492DRAFT_850528 [Pavlovales sp. CCMP2436]|nr:hypothetical protein T492DRAFT_850528 [Pavlovales sp. CCMP2436]